MKLIRDLAALSDALRGGAVAIGNFDGVHLGHAAIARRLLDRARQFGGAAVVFTFDPHPVRILRPTEAPPPLTWTDRKAELLAELEIDAMVAYPTDEALLNLAPREFFVRIVRDRLQAKAMVEGPNFYFGHDRTGNIEVLQSLTAEAGITLDIAEPVVVGGEIVSSSRVRRLVAAGDVDQARQILTQPYRIRGMVVHGAGRGNKIGFPTANVTSIDTLLPGAGVYAGRALFEREWQPAAINIGPNPTFGEQAMKVEAHLIDWNGSLYGQPLEIDFLRRLRDIQRFATADALVEQMRRDVAATELEAKRAPSPLASTE